MKKKPICQNQVIAKRSLFCVQDIAGLVLYWRLVFPPSPPRSFLCLLSSANPRLFPLGLSSISLFTLGLYHTRSFPPWSFLLPSCLIQVFSSMDIFPPRFFNPGFSPKYFPPNELSLLEFFHRIFSPLGHLPINFFTLRLKSSGMKILRRNVPDKNQDWKNWIWKEPSRKRPWVEKTEGKKTKWEQPRFHGKQKGEKKPGFKKPSRIITWGRHQSKKDLPP